MRYDNLITAENTRSDRESNLQYHSLIGLVSFLIISIGAFTFKGFNLFGVAPESIRQILGYPPPAYLISIALAVYAFSSAILTLTAMANGTKPMRKWNHLGYRSAFFIFYCFSGTIAANFLPVLMVGLVLYGLDQFHIALYNAKINHEGKGLLGKF